MRISTAGMHRGTISAILDSQARLSKTQNQVATGKKFQSASEDPIGATRVQGLERKLADNAQYARNSNIIGSRLSYEEQTLADITSVLQSARDSALAGGNATLGQDERKMLASQVRQNLAALMLRNIDAQVRKMISSPVAGVTGNYTTLASLGITTQADGKLKLDADKFNAALNANPGAVSDIFTSSNGVAVKLADFM